jgi:hypothetical protein
MVPPLSVDAPTRLVRESLSGSAMADILVAGAAGFIGYHVSLRLLKRGDSATTLDNFNDYRDVSLKEARLKDLEAYPNFQFVKLNLPDQDGVNELLQARKIAVRSPCRRLGMRPILIEQSTRVCREQSCRFPEHPRRERAPASNDLKG